MRARLLSALVIVALVAIGAFAYRRYRPLVTLDTSEDPATFLTSMGNSAADEFGHAVSGCGDVNLDGFADFVVGAPNDDTAGIDAGAVTLFSGSTGEVIRTWRGPGAGFLHGSDVVCFGERIAIGATSSGLVPGSAGGGVYVYPLEAEEPAYVLVGAAKDDYFGHALADAGDLNGDGTDDLLVGAPGSYKKNIPGFVAAYSGVDGEKLLELGGDGPIGDRFGFSVAGAEDQTGDGRPDILVGAVGHREHRGQVTLFDGADGTVLRTWVGDGPGQELGHDVDALSDLDGDGRPELMMGAFHRGGVGYVRVVDAAGSTQFEIRGVGSSDGFAHSIARIDDVDLDGVPDVAVGAPDAEVDGIAEVGYVGVYSGASGQLIDVVQGRRELGHFGYVVRAMGDVDADGRGDVLVGTVVIRGRGRAHVLIGANLQR